MKLNRVTVASPQKKAYDLDAKDFFWAKNAANPFPQVAEDIDAELNKYKQDAAEITRSTGVSDVNDITQLCEDSFPRSFALIKPARQEPFRECISSQNGHHPPPKVNPPPHHPLPPH